jgi:transposase
MQTQVRYLGVDVSKDMLVVAFERNRWQFPNSKEGYGKLITHIQKQASTVHVVCEATGPYHLPMCLALQQAGLPVTVANPAWIKFFGRSEGVLAKTDPIDAALIERYANARRPAADTPIRREQIGLIELVNHRAQLVDSKTALLNMRAQVLDPTVGKEIDRSIAALDRCIEAAERRLKEKIEADPRWKEKLAILTSVKGVGFTTAAALLAKMPELGQLNRGQCAALAGLAPYDNDSGTFSGERSICGGRSDVRRALYMAAITAARHNSVLRLFYERLISAKKPFKVAITAVMRKLLLYLNSLLKAADIERRSDLSIIAPV